MLVNIPETVMVAEIWSVWNGIGFKEDHTHNSKDVSHGKQQDSDEYHRLCVCVCVCLGYIIYDDSLTLMAFKMVKTIILSRPKRATCTVNETIIPSLPHTLDHLLSHTL